MTTTRCAVSAMTPMSWVMSMTAMLSLVFSSFSSSRIWAWMVTSSAVVGSSAIRRFGLHDSAMAIMIALPHAARELVRVLLHPALGVGDVHQLQHLDRLVHRVAAAQPLVQADGLGDLLAAREDRVERGHRLLEDHRDLFAADLAHLCAG